MHLVCRRASQLAAPQRAVEPPKSAPLSAQHSIPRSHSLPNILTGDLHRGSPDILMRHTSLWWERG